MPTVLLTYVAEKEFKNLEYGMERGMWGLPVELHDAPKNFDFVFISSLIKPGGPRTPETQWPEKTLTMTVARRTGAVTAGRSRFWPDEVSSGTVRYRTRFPVDHLRTKNNVALNGRSALPYSVIMEIRHQAITNTTRVISVDAAIVDRLIQ